MYNIFVYFFVFFLVLFCLGDACGDLPIYIAYFLSESDIWDIIAFFENLDILVSSFPPVYCLMQDCGLEKTSTPKFFQVCSL